MRFLKAQVKREAATQLKSRKEALKEFTTIDEILDKWQYRTLIPSSSKQRKWRNEIELKTYLVNRMVKASEKSLNKELERIDTVSNADDVVSVTINVEWTKGGTYGAQAVATAEVRYKGGEYAKYYGQRTSGYGYDKESTAIASALNQSNGLLKAMYRIKNSSIHVHSQNRNLIGYGSGYGTLPYFEGGVGVTCMYRICDNINLKFKSIAFGKLFNVYSITKK